MATSTPTINPESHPPPFDLMSWIAEHRAALQPPVGNKMIYARHTQFKIMVVGGPNIRTDYHINTGEEWFYQLKGDMVLKIVDGKQFKDVVIREGDCYLLQSNVPHSPQRLADTLGLVIEHERSDSELDGLRWYCRSCYNICYEDFFHCEDLGAQLKVKINDYYSDAAKRTCRHCGVVDEVPSIDRQAIKTVEDIIQATRTHSTLPSKEGELHHHNQPVTVDHVSYQSVIVESGTYTAAPPHTVVDAQSHPAPFSLSQFITNNESSLRPPVNNKLLFGGTATEYQVQIVGGPNIRTDYHIEDGEEWFYQLKGDMVLKIVENGAHRDVVIRQGESFLLPPNIPHSPQRFANTVGLVVEFTRKPQWKDGLRWYCSQCAHIVHEDRFDCVDLGSQLNGLINDYYSQQDKRKCPHCGTVDERHFAKASIPPEPTQQSTTVTLA